MRKAKRHELRSEYRLEDLGRGVRGKYYRRLLKEGTNVVVLEPDVAKAFRDSAAVNDALRSFLKVARYSQRLTARTGRTARKHTAA